MTTPLLLSSITTTTTTTPTTNLTEVSPSNFEIIGLIYYGYGSGLPKNIQLGFEITLTIWHILLTFASLALIIASKRLKYNAIAKLVFYIIFIHALAKSISNLIFVYLLCASSSIQHKSASITFETFELCGIISYYCMYGIVLFSWVEVVFRVEHLGHGEDRVRIWRNLFCVFTSIWIVAIFIISELFVNVDRNFAIMVFGIGLIVISIFSFALSIAFIVYWIKLHRMVRSIKLASSIQANPNSVSPFLRRVGVMAIIFILCLDVKIVHYFINIDSPFQSTIWDLYALNYLPEAIAVTVALIFFASSYVRNNDHSNSNSNNISNSMSASSTHSHISFNTTYMSETEKANLKRREEKMALLN